MTREEAKEVFLNRGYVNGLFNGDKWRQSVVVISKWLEQEPKTGHWINVEDRTDWYDATYKCSCCDREIITPYDLKNNLYSDYPYCHCGAKMIDTGK